MYYEGQEFDYNFSHFWLKVKTRFEFTEDEEMAHWQVELYRKTKDGLELIDELKVGHVGCEYGEYC